MKTILLSLICCITTTMACAQPGTITNIQISQRPDGTGVVDIYFDLNGSGSAYNIEAEISFDGGTNYQSISTNYLAGDVDMVSPGTGLYIVWDAMASFPNYYSTQPRLRIMAIADNGNGPQPGDGVTDIDDNFYPSVIIGNQEWMAENLRVTRYNNEDEIPTGLSDDDWGSTTSGAYTIYPHEGGEWDDEPIEGIDSDEEMVAAYGKLYNWYAVDDARGLCPQGWSLPSDEDWIALVNYVASEGFLNEYNNLNGAGNALKSCRQVNSPLGVECNTSTHPRWNSHSTHYGFDEFGFSTLPGGYRDASGHYHFIGYVGHWWSSSEDSVTNAWFRFMFSYFGHVSRSSNDKRNGFSIRCFRDIAEEPTLHNLQLEVNPEGAGTVYGAGEYQEGEVVNIAAAANDGWEFVEWTGDTGQLDEVNSAEAVATMPADNVSLTAVFQEEDEVPVFTCGDNITFTYNGEEVTYGTIPRNGLCWLDRNLGADPMPFVPADDATGNTDTRLYGDLYQWGRAADGHQKRNSGTTSTLSDSDTPGHGNFILAPEDPPWDWRSPPNENLWQGVNGVNNPCPPGYRLPTLAEWQEEHQSWINNDASGAFASPLKLPLAGRRSRHTGSLQSVGTYGGYWGQNDTTTLSIVTVIYGDNAFVGSTCRAFGRSVRCLKD